MKRIVLMGASLFMLLAASPVRAQKKEDKKTTVETKKESKVKKSSTELTTAMTADAGKKGKKEKEQPKTTTTTAVTKDKEVGKDAQGRTLYEGPKGGRYYLNKDGKKVYVKK